MNILIVDDEYYIVKNIIDNIDWSQLGIENAFPAYSADQARKVMLKEKIDLVLTDIEMPRENGLELIRWIQGQKMHPVVLILTGHQRFDYAQAAISLHIFSYILKPVDLNNLRQQLTLAISEYNRVEKLWAEPAPAPVLPSVIAAGTPDPAARSASSDPVEKIKAIVLENLSDPELNRQMIADQIHMNLDYMSHLFSTRTGSSLSSYIQDVRIQEACKLLRNTGLTLGEISSRTGFSNTSYFHRQFKKSCGMTPQQYREQQ